MKTIRYALRNAKTKILLGYEITANGPDAQDCGETTCKLRDDASLPVWTAEYPALAEWVRWNSTPWYNSSLENPGHDFEADELEVVRYEVEVTITPETVKIPTLREVVAAKDKHFHNKDTSRQVAYYQLNENGFEYSWYDLWEYFYQHNIPKPPIPK